METNNDSLSSVQEEDLAIIQNKFLETFSNEDSLESYLAKQDAKNELALFQTLSNVLSGYNLETDEFWSQEPEIEEEDPEFRDLTVHPLVLEERNMALTMLDELLLSADKMIEELEASMQGPICPYEQSLQEYLGPNYVIPSIQSLTIPKNFNLVKSVDVIENHIQKIDSLMDQQFDVMLEEARDTNFPGITSEHVGNAFAELSATKNGKKFVLNKVKLAQHLEFAEIVRNLPTEEILANPWTVAFKLISRYSEIAV